MQIVNLATWKRLEHYKFFHGMDYPQYNICMNLDITHFLGRMKDRKLPFYYAMIYASMQVANEIEEFKYRIRGEVMA